jgi:hypothetical protein
VQTPTRRLEDLGFSFGRNGPHSARTMMLPEARTLLARVRANAPRERYVSDVVDHNALHKPTQKARALTARHLVALYGLDPQISVFRALRRLWSIDATAQPLLALTISLARDPLLRLSWEFMVGKKPGEPVAREDVQALLAAEDPDRFTPASLKSFAQNINGSWTQAGYLTGKVKKRRASPVTTPANFAYAAFLAHLEGYRGQRLMDSRWIGLLDRSLDAVVELAAAASRRGLLVFMNAGGVMETRFPGYLLPEEERAIHEPA